VSFLGDLLGHVIGSFKRANPLRNNSVRLISFDNNHTSTNEDLDDNVHPLGNLFMVLAPKAVNEKVKIVEFREYGH
jgi:hypothetical protein